MTRAILTAAAILTVAAPPSFAQPAAAPAPAPVPAARPGPPPEPPRAPGPPLMLAVEAAQVAIATCLANGYKTTALVADAEGLPVAMLSADGVARRTQRIAPSKVATVVKYGVPSGDIADRVKTDSALAAEIEANPAIGTARRGALPIRKDGALRGVMAVSGAPGGDKDEVCVNAGLARIAGRL